MYLIFDFDGTITVKDTIHELARSAIAYQKEHRGLDLEAAWKRVVDDYVADVKDYAQQWPTPAAEITTMEEQQRYLAGSKAVEERSLERVGKARLFEGMEEVELVKAGMEAVASGRVEIRKGFIDVLSLAQEKGWDVAVVSVNWSRSFIHGVLQPHTLNVVSNEFSAEGEVQGPAILDTGGSMMTNGEDKREVVRRLVSEKGNDAMVYFGDSVTDLACLLDGRGVVIAPDEKTELLKVLNRVGSEVPHVASGRTEDRMFWARDFDEVLQSGVLG